MSIEMMYGATLSSNESPPFFLGLAFLLVVILLIGIFLK